MSDEATGASGGPAARAVRTFLIADLRGYTRYSQEHGDEAASRLTRDFAAIVGAAVQGSDGTLLELRGDETLCVFDSARGALAAAVEIQRRSRQPEDDETPLPLGVGVGVDAGEAIPMEGGFRGRSLNVAARLCSLAGPGEILATDTVARLAGQDERVRFAPRRAVRVKGVDEPVRLVEVVPAVALPPPPAQRRSKRRLGRLEAALGAALLAAALVTAVLLFRGSGSDGVTAVPPNSLAVIDARTKKLTWHVPVGDSPTLVSAAGGNAWTLNRAQTISLVDLGTRSLVRTFGIAARPAGIAADKDGLWVGDGTASAVLRIEPESARVVDTIDAPPRGRRPSFAPPGTALFDAGPLALGAGSVWFLSGNATLTRIDPAVGRPVVTIKYPGIGAFAVHPELGGIAYVAVADGVVWVFAWSSELSRNELSRIDPATNAVLSSALLTATGPFAAGLGAVWIANGVNNQVWQVDPGSETGSTPPTVVRTIDVGAAPVALAVGAGSLWVATAHGTVLVVDPASGAVTDRIPVGRTLGGIAVDGDAVWVTVD